jgi:ATP-dependent DNA helicase DinG
VRCIGSSPTAADGAPALAVGVSEAVWLTPDGEIERLKLAEAVRRAQAQPPLAVHARAVARRLGQPPFPNLDLLELFAFVRPAAFVLPTSRGLASALGLRRPETLEDEALTLVLAAECLLAELAARPAAADPDAPGILRAMARGGWRWAASVEAALARRAGPFPKETHGIAAWRRLPEWSEEAPPPAPANAAVHPASARRRLAELVGAGAEPRPSQADYADAISAAFRARERRDEPHAVLAEAGTGVGKTLGYIAPASLWAEANEGAVWLSTYTRNLQHQIAQEVERLWPDPVLRAARLVIRKGRENYLCLLNFEEAVGGLPMRPFDATALGLVARWIGATEDGDLMGGDFPAFLPGRFIGLQDRRGECIHSACPHYRRCFIERGIRKARHARLVVANHALVMIQAALGGLGDTGLPTRYVFDEGHHVFDAADSAFSLRLSGLEAAEMRRWVLGNEGGRGRARGLRRRIEDLVAGDEPAEKALNDATVAARALPGEGWGHRLAEGRALGPAESFLRLVRQQVMARARDIEAGYSLEAEARPPIDGLLDAAASLDAALERLARPLLALAEILSQRLEDEDAETLETGQRTRIEAVARGLRRRAEVQLDGWRRALQDLAKPASEQFVDWLMVEREGGLEGDIGLCRHWVDPTIPFVEAVAKPAHGFVVTSATLTDGPEDDAGSWDSAEARTGARHLAAGALRARVPSPFDYPAQTRVFVVTDVDRRNMGQVAAAYRALIEAAQGGTLGLFTAIARLKAVHERIAGPLEAAGFPLLAQHVDGMDAATLVDIFRAEEDSSLLGTDALRDGVDVPGRSLRLVVFDRVPWPRPDILHKARKAAFGQRWDDLLTRLRLKQAYGRLVRRAGDTGVFVLLDAQFPSRLHTAFPPGVAVERLGIKDAVERTRAFLDRRGADAALSSASPPSR